MWNSEARALFFNFSSAAHFSIGSDALWLDATEPEGFPHEVACLLCAAHSAPSFYPQLHRVTRVQNQVVAMGSANELFNSYSLLTSSAISDGLREFYPEAQGRRVFSLTRSSFAGQQRTGAALWSGDISGSWDAMRRQISASLNYQMSGAHSSIELWARGAAALQRRRLAIHSRIRTRILEHGHWWLLPSRRPVHFS